MNQISEKLPKVEKKEGWLVLQPSAVQIARAQAAADHKLLQSGKATPAELAAILERVLIRLEGSG